MKVAAFVEPDADHSTVSMAGSARWTDHLRRIVGRGCHLFPTEQHSARPVLT
jgi:hypothetical protein